MSRPVPTLDPVFVAKRLAALEHHLAVLDRILADERSDDDLPGIFSFIASVEACREVAAHGVAKARARRSCGDADAFAVLSEAGLLDAGLAKALGRAARARDKYLHLYWAIDGAEVAAAIAQARPALGDFVAWATARVAT
ncbi:MAG: hypothetical protein CSA66_04735 [Proteobacteria bacterium]|nr:MAG: hypothetical protein CSA66_04735 [Pseudomonadota bacterium]